MVEWVKFVISQKEIYDEVQSHRGYFSNCEMFREDVNFNITHIDWHFIACIDIFPL